MTTAPTTFPGVHTLEGCLTPLSSERRFIAS